MTASSSPWKNYLQLQSMLWYNKSWQPYTVIWYVSPLTGPQVIQISSRGCDGHLHWPAVFPFLTSDMTPVSEVCWETLTACQTLFDVTPMTAEVHALPTSIYHNTNAQLHAAHKDSILLFTVILLLSTVWCLNRFSFQYYHVLILHSINLHSANTKFSKWRKCVKLDTC